MNLKTDIDEQNQLNTGSKGLKLADVDNEKMNGQAAGWKESWDFSEEIEPVRITAVDSALKREAGELKETNVANVFLLISQIILYALIVAEIAALAYISSKEPFSILNNMLTFKGLFQACTVYFIVDSILVNVLFERKISLIIFAWLLPFLYPWMRQSHVKGKGGIGGIVTLIYFLSLGAFIMAAGRQYMYYGGIMLEKDAAVRAAAAKLLEQIQENGETMGDLFYDHYSIDTVTAKKEGNQTVIVFSGNGLFYLEQDTFVRNLNKTIPTQMTFVRSGNDIKYQLQAVNIDGVELSERGIKNYWQFMLQ